MGYSSCPTSGAFRLRQNLQPVNQAHKEAPLPIGARVSRIRPFTANKPCWSEKALAVAIRQSARSPLTNREPTPLTPAAGWGELAKNAG